MTEGSLRSEFVSQLVARGMIHDSTDLGAIDALAARGALHAYAGYDLTAPSLHVGNLASLMVLAWLQRTGAGRPVVLLGAGTTQVGDPSGKSRERPLMDLARIGENRRSLSRAFGSVVDLGSRPGPLGPVTTVGARALAAPDGLVGVVADNDDWLSELGHLDFLREVGRHFRVSTMLAKDSVRERLDGDEGMSFLEFSYMLLQAYDFVELARRHGVVLQVGGSDQWGNVTAGIDLGRRLGRPGLMGLTCPLLRTADGRKMGKTERGAVWLDPDLLHPGDYWQFWRDVADDDVGPMLRRMTFLPLDEVARLERLRGTEANVAKVALADAATAVVHGADAARSARQVAEGGRGAMREVEVAPGVMILDAAVRAGFARGTGEARRLLDGGGVRLDGKRVADPRTTLTREVLGRGATLSVGRRVVRLVGLGEPS